ncbi:hypothetical protein Kisp02_08520 [Kineosporia sp. NBRC 101731]|nr:hypothetical protein Kisp02_08520 [Kineosporia sp. NBRC 101731]
MTVFAVFVALRALRRSVSGFSGVAAVFFVVALRATASVTGASCAVSGLLTVLFEDDVRAAAFRVARVRAVAGGRGAGAAGSGVGPAEFGRGPAGVALSA